jgi:hypothetical protein
MSPLRIVGYAGLTVLSATGLLLMVLSFGTGTWHGVVFGAGALVLAAARWVWRSPRCFLKEASARCSRGPDRRASIALAPERA